MTQTFFTFAQPQPGLRVSITTQPAQDLGAVLCRGRFATPLGTVVAMGAGGALWGLGFAGAMSEDQVEADLAARWPRARLVEASEALAPSIQALLAGEGVITVHLTGTEFQLQVWRALVTVPPGQVISYATLAERIGRPNALRAVGTAVGQNPVSWAIPCHRVTRTGGRIGGYHWGEAVKRALLVREGASIAPRTIAAL
ncbi:methylated-DNA--[protein]-cysteine S-methyltransferase [Paracoccus denitrificans]|jgi:AraC family transcriptional regulator of adaptative response/methylated-DNA-[protein]-cysteine methyltransferase|uniref:methylated-DNA--[protein]-cysteine S-methyltransferase n=1 Tax=Paracoccus denitrificans (strain Pd 1222) TaxID=318586 RepID=A1B614_PARDP|nr:methylated-DNA--[protein]-cysteine S-methyltransferase [Paracoccus denitrificans]ABL70958.1 methylated-DNA--protein-cysteine methyltransferase [Paracoccus denitrificans PD1222]MBB4626613.1 AraC family transcriptional regulator of adaptative response/methylated-DNA-[protein]-cysteine methyltransferase [Paracoccus denitrificans]MCU7428744.1 methylated-DNA--[protein]-cysteine S-methyltransferase [Paracoccus denitrificans]UPV97324.1 methylated-DNA--[protein]-cysteine S-methyltransferase [Paracoc